jgi:glycosyltransferase involved in cell wall biosynthesis
MRVRLVTPWGTACGIAEHSKMLRDAVEAADPSITFWIDTDLHPDALWRAPEAPDVVLLNYHAGLHSQWTPAHVKEVRKARIPVVVIYHDTGVPNSEQCHRLFEATTHYPQLAPGAFIIHEPAEDLPGAVYLRQGVPARPFPAPATPWLDEFRSIYYASGRPILGTVGFPFPWKNYDLLVDATALAGWALLLLAPGATEAQIAAWQGRNPAMLVVADFIPADAVVAYLGGCDATAFLYACANTGTSGAIRQGIAARKPVLATSGCRQFRDLEGDRIGARALTWLSDLSVEGVAAALESVVLQRVDPAVVRLAERDSWRRRGQELAELLRGVQRGDGVGQLHGTTAEQTEGQQP